MSIEREIRQRADTLRNSLPAPDFTQPSPHPVTLDEIAEELAAEYGDALRLLGRL